MEIDVEVDNTIGAKKGDYVEVDMDHVNALKAIGIVYGYPLIGLIIGIVGSNYILSAMGVKTGKEVLVFLFGIFFTFLAYMFVKKKDSKLKHSKEYLPVITRIIPVDEENVSGKVIDLNSPDKN